MRLALLLCLFFHLVGDTPAQDIDLPRKAPKIGLCDLIENSPKYENRDFVVRATLRYSFEQSVLYCLPCVDNEVWLQFEESFKTNRRYARMINENGFRGRTVNVEVVGVLRYGNGFGHQGAYRYMFVVKTLRWAEIVADKGVVPDKLTKGKRKRVCHQERESMTEGKRRVGT